jgi:PAS domain S-box-containing protein
MKTHKQTEKATMKRREITFLISALPFILIILAIFFLAEILIINLFHEILPMSNTFLYAISDAFIITAVGTPFLFWFGVKSRQGEEKIRNEMEFNANLLKGLKDGFAAIDQEGNQIRVNDELCKMTGYTEQELLNQKPPFNYWAEEGLNDIKEVFEKSLKGIEGEYELIFKRKNNERFIALVSPRKTIDPNGNVIFFATVKDITERKRVEIVIKESEARLSEAQRIAHIGNWEWKIKTNELYWSEETYRICGLSREVRLSVEAFLNAVHPDDLKFVKKSIDDGLHGKPYDVDIRIIRPDGQERIVNAKADVYFDEENKPVRMNGTVQDITERKHGEESLRLFRDLIDKSNDAIFVNDTESGIILDANEKACSSLGYTRYELLNMHVYEFEVTLPDTFSWKEHVKEVQKKGSLVLEGLHKRKDGTTFPIEANVKFHNYGNKSRLVAIVRDISERKKSEEMFLENERLANASKAKSDFLSNMSHELRTPLNAVIGFSELLKMKKFGNLTDKQEGYVDNIRYGGRHLLNLISDILDLSKLDAGKMELVIENISVPETLNQAIVMVEEMGNKTNVTLKKELDLELAFIEVDKQRFIQILFNLLSNAVKFNRKEGGAVTITTEREGDMAKFSVSDTGIGIKEEDKNKLFIDFEQLDSGISRKYGGTGLGLAITKKLVELHGGKIWVDSEFGVGSTFTFSLPIKAKKTEKNT